MRKASREGVPRGTSSREHEDRDTSRNEGLESINRIRAVPIVHRSTLMEHMRAVGPRDLLEAQVEDRWSSRVAW